MPPWNLSSWTLAIMTSVVSIQRAIEAAFWKAVRMTLAWSMTPAATTRRRIGTSTDIPAAGDYDSDGKTDQDVFTLSNSRWQVNNPTG